MSAPTEKINEDTFFKDINRNTTYQQDALKFSELIIKKIARQNVYKMRIGNEIKSYNRLMINNANMNKIRAMQIYVKALNSNLTDALQVIRMFPMKIPNDEYLYQDPFELEQGYYKLILMTALEGFTKEDFDNAMWEESDEDMTQGIYAVRSISNAIMERANHGPAFFPINSKTT